jgi:hypothetical protein
VAQYVQQENMISEFDDDETEDPEFDTKTVVVVEEALPLVLIV